MPDQMRLRSRADNNQLSGSIPVELTQMTQLTPVSLVNNSLTGPLPSFWNDPLIHVHAIALDHNMLTGTIPALSGDVMGVHRLTLSYNQLNGALPPSVGKFKNIRVL